MIYFSREQRKRISIILTDIGVGFLVGLYIGYFLEKGMGIPVLIAVSMFSFVCFIVAVHFDR